MGQIILLRHGQANLLGDDYDQLSDIGCEQARITGAVLAARGIQLAEVFSGALKRQSETARIAAAAAGFAKPVLIDPGFDEYSHADLFASAFPHLATHAIVTERLSTEADPRRAFQELFETAFKAWTGGAVGPTGVSWADFRQRVLNAVIRVAQRCASRETVLVVSSGGAIAAIVQWLLGVPDHKLLKLHNPIYNASLTRLRTRGDQVGLITFNDVSHLMELSRPDRVTFR